MAIVTPKILPGEKGYVSKKERSAKAKVKEKKDKKRALKKEKTIGRIKPGYKGYRIGKLSKTPRGEMKFPVWRYSKKIGEILVKNKDLADEEVSLKFNRFGGVGNYKHLIQDADFQMQWAIREQELLMTQDKCHVCKKKINRSSQPNLYHYKMWKYRSELIEKAEKVPEGVISGKLTIEDGWNKFNDILEEGNRYFMSLKDTALVCSTCAKAKGLKF